MPVSVPSRDPSSLGPALSNTRAPAANELSAIHVENIKQSLIDFAGEFNTGLVVTDPVEPVDEGASPAGNTPAGSADLLFTSTLPDEPASYVSPYWLWLEDTLDGSTTEYVLVIGRTGATRHLASKTVYAHLAGDDTRYHYAGPALGLGGGTLTPEMAAKVAVLPASGLTGEQEAKLDSIEENADVTTFGRVQAALAVASGNVSINGNKLTGVDGPTDAQDATNLAFVEGVQANIEGQLANAIQDLSTDHVVTSHSSGTFNLDLTHQVVRLVKAANDLSVQLPDPATYAGKICDFFTDNDGTHTVTFLRFGSEQINGRAASAIRTARNARWSLVSDGTDWYLIGKNKFRRIYTASDTLVWEAGWSGVMVYLRAGAGGGGGGGGGAAGASGNVGGGGGGKGGGGGAPAHGFWHSLEGIAPGTTLTLTVGAGGAAGAAGAIAGTGGTGGDGGASEILDGATRLVRSAKNSLALGAGGGTGGSNGIAGTNAGGAGGTSGGTGATAAMTMPSGFSGGFTAPSGGNGGAGGTAAIGNNGTTTGTPPSTGGPWYGNQIPSAAAGQFGAASGGTHGGGGGGGAGGSGQIGDEFSPAGVESAANDGRGGTRATTEGNGGAANSAGAATAGTAGAAGSAGTNGRGGGGGMGGGGGGAGSVTGGAGAVGGAGGAGSAGVIVVEGLE
jgi:hypothetical protein